MDFNLTEYSNLIEEINKANLEIPFGNSKYQNLNFVINNEITDGRKLRHCLLRLNNRIAALRECYYNVKLEDIDIEEMEEKLGDATKYEKLRLEIKLEQKKANRIQLEKMVLDCQIEIKDLYSIFKQLPKMTRDDFEKEEQEHFELKFAKELSLSKEFGGNKTIMSSIDNMGNESLARVSHYLKNPNELKENVNKSRLSYE